MENDKLEFISPVDTITKILPNMEVIERTTRLSTTTWYRDMATSLKKKGKREFEQNICSVKDRNDIKPTGEINEYILSKFNKNVLLIHKSDIRSTTQIK